MTFLENINIHRILKLILYITPQILLVLSLIFKWKNKVILNKLFISLFYVTSIVIIIYSLLIKFNIISKFSSIKSLKQYILSTREKGVLVYILIQLLQVVFLPIPASVICIVGSLIYGPLLGSLYCCIGVCVGSLISFFVGRIFGFKLVTWIVGKENTEKYSEIIRKRGIVFLGLAFLLPMFPDDILCFIAGVTKIKVKNFIWVTILTRPIGVICMAIFGSGYIIPYRGWGIYAWVLILIIAMTLVYIVLRFQDKLQEFILKKVLKHDPQKNKKH